VLIHAPITSLPMDLELVDQRRFDNGTMYVRYDVK
jgi:hypothetical protein